MVEFFVAGSWRNHDAVAKVLTALDRHGRSSYSFIRAQYSGLAMEFAGPDAIDGRDLSDPSVVHVFEQDLAAQRSAQNFVLVLPAGASGHIEAGIAFGSGKPCYAVGPVNGTDSLYRIFDRLFANVEEFEGWLQSIASPGGYELPAH